MTVIFGFAIITMFLFAGYMSYRLFVRRSFSALICLSLELFAITIALFSFILNIQTSNTVEVFYLVLGIIVPAGFVVYDYSRLMKKIKEHGLNEQLLGGESFTDNKDTLSKQKCNDDPELWLPVEEDIFSKLTDIEPTDYKSYYRLGLSCYQMGLKEKAIECFKRVIEVNPSSVKAYYKMAVALDEIGESEDAIQAFKKVIRIKPEMIDAYNKLAAILSVQGKIDEALYTYANGLEKNPDEFSFYFNIGITLSQTGRFSEAVEAYRKALKLKPNEHEIGFHLGAALIELKRYDEATEAYKSELNNKPSDSELFYNLSVVYSLLKKREIAIDNLRKAIEINSDFKGEAKMNKAFDFIKSNSDFKKLVS